MESVEVWMWVIAGLLIGGIIFVGSFKLLSNYVSNQESSQMQSNFNLLFSSLSNVCYGGSNNREIRSFKFPYIAEKIYVKDDEGLENLGMQLCYDTKDEKGFCLKLEICNVTMKTIDLTQKTSVFYAVQKFLGKKKISQIKFSINKPEYNSVIIDWKKEVAE